MKRSGVAFIIAPLWVPAAVAGFAYSVMFPYAAQFHWVVISTIIAAIFAYAGAFGLGLPALGLLRKRGTAGPLGIGLLGLVAGAGTWLLFSICFVLFLGEGIWGIGFLAKQTMQRGLIDLLVPAVLGGLVGVTYWAIARPDRDQVEDIIL